MAEPEDTTTNKRKASPEPPAEDVAAKRTKIIQDGDGRDHVAPSNSANRDDGAIDRNVEDPANGAPEARREREEPRQERRSPPRTNEAAAGPEAGRSPESRRPSGGAGFPGRRSFSLEEKKRGQRLFGSLVSTLSRAPSSGSQHQKRLEIERRQHEKAQQRRAEDEKRRTERLEKLKRTRQIEQIKLEEQAMKTRHSAMLARAHSLQTRSEPRIYYLPWELTRAQEETIREQIRAAEETIERETRDFEARKEQRLRELGVATRPRPATPPRAEEAPPPPPEEAAVGEPKPPPQDTNPDAAAPPSPSPPPPKTRNDHHHHHHHHHHEKDHDEHADEMMQDEEDTVIY